MQPKVLFVPIWELAPEVYDPSAGQELSLRLVPGSRVRQLTDFPARLHEAGCGAELSREAIAFIEKEETNG